MAVTSPIAWATIEKAIRDWLATCTGITVIWSDEHANQPAWPYATVKIISGPVQLGHDERRATVDDKGTVTREVRGPRDLTVSCQVHCASDAAGANATHYLGIAQASLGLPSVLEAFRAAGVAVVDAGDVQDLTFIAGGAVRSRGAMDVRLRVTSSIADTTQDMATAGLVGQLYDAAGNLAIEADSTIGTPPPPPEEEEEEEVEE